MNKKIIILCVIYILFIIFQYFNSNYKEYQFKNSNNSKKLNDNIIYNNIHKEELNIKIYDIITERINLLINHKMNYQEWLKYNQENIWVDIDGHKYYICIWDYTNKNFYLEAYPIEKYLNLSWDDYLKEQNNELSFAKYTTDKELLLNMYNDISEEYNVYSNFFVSPLYNKIIRRNLIPKMYNDGKYNTGLMYISYEIENLSDTNTLFYYRVLPIYIIIIFSLLSFILSIIIYSLDTTNFILPLIILIILNLYITYYLGIQELYSTLQMEIDKFTNISSGVLSISFLISASIFILSALQKKSNMKNLFQKAAFLFVISFILLLVSIFKETNYSNYYNIAQIRVTKQFIFNYTVLLNLFIILNYVIYINSSTIKEFTKFKDFIYKS